MDLSTWSAGYAAAQVADLAARSKEMSRWRLWVEFPAAFLKAYLLRRYVLRGRAGYMVARNYAIYRHRRVAMALARKDPAPAFPAKP